MPRTLKTLIFILFATGCRQENEPPPEIEKAPYLTEVRNEAEVTNMSAVDNWPDSSDLQTGVVYGIETGKTTPQEVVTFANSLMGTPYRYGSIDPLVGFDCSGFITYVFSHFKIKVPRSSVDFTEVGKQVDIADAKQGDIILFTGTNPSERTVGHMGIVNRIISDEDVEFIHSSSGKAYGVTLSSLSPNYKLRFVKVIRIFPQNDR